MAASALVVSWWWVLFGAVVGPLVGAGVLWVAGERERPTLTATAAGVCLGTLVWNVMLNVRRAVEIDVDVPFVLFPISWQDAGTGVFSFAFATAALLVTVHRDQPGHRTLKVAGIATAAAFIVDLYVW